MGRTIFIYGLTAGVLTLMLVGAGVGLVGLTQGIEGTIWGYGSMAVGLSLILVGVRRYAVLNGPLTFGQAFLLAFGIFAFAAVVYALGWEIYLAATNYRFASDYASQIISAKVAEGANAAQLAAVEAKMASFKSQYANPIFRIAMTVMEIAPVGIIMSLLAAATMRTRSDDERAVVA